MEVRAESDELAAGLADVLDRHLVRFGERDELVVTFEAVPALLVPCFLVFVTLPRPPAPRRAGAVFYARCVRRLPVLDAPRCPD